MQSPCSAVSELTDQATSEAPPGRLLVACERRGLAVVIYRQHLSEEHLVIGLRASMSGSYSRVETRV